jgi:choline dehydrogenase
MSKFTTNEQFDCIIIGAGSAGCVLANRLSANPATRVLLLEAGQHDRLSAIEIPAGFPKLLKTDRDWAYYTEPQPHLGDRQLYWPRGKTIGGSSSINATIYIRGHRWDFDRWDKLGNSGWSYQEMLPYFKKAECQERGASEYHAADGLLSVSDLRYKNSLSHTFIEAAAEIGIPQISDFNVPEPEGVGFYQVTHKNGRRHSSAAAYLKPCLHRPNLRVCMEAHVTRILWGRDRGENNRAVGVEYQCGGQLVQVNADREVLLCGGAINSPQLLMLSGVGDARSLAALGIPIIADIPGVGQNLQDHLRIETIAACTQPISLDGANTTANLLKYWLWKRGPLASNLAEAGGFVKTRSEFPRPDLQFHFVPGYFLDHGFTKQPGYGFSLSAALLRPHSRGYLQLKSADPLAHPLIQPNYLQQEADLPSLIEGIRLSRHILQATAFDRVRGPELFPGDAVQTDAEIVDYIRAKAESIYHPVGTCKMGVDAMAVVNSQLQVYGTQGLRVVDASIMPEIVGGNTNAPTIAIAEKAAELIVNS